MERALGDTDEPMNVTPVGRDLETGDARAGGAGVPAETKSKASRDSTESTSTDGLDAKMKTESTMQPWQSRALTNLRMEDPMMLRGMPVAKLLRSFASVLSDNKGNPKHYALSQPVSSIDTFVSHTWRTPRWKKLMVLVFHFNKFSAMLISFMVAALLCALTVQGTLPSVVVEDKGQSFTRGFLSLPVGIVIFFVALFAVRELDNALNPLRRRCHTIFLDKTCVHQTDVKLKQKGIESLAAYLNNSQEMLVLYTDLYMQRLWTIYEVASWLLLHKGQKMTARPLSAAMLVLAGFFFLSLNHVMWLVFSYTNTVMDLPAALEMSFSIMVTLAIFTIAACLSAKWAVERARLISHVDNFRLSNAECFCEDDRQVVQQNIVAFMKHASLSDAEASDQEVFEAFETLIRKEVPKLMWGCFTRVGMPYTWSIVMGFPNILAALDLGAGWLLDGKSPRYVALWTVMSVASMTLVAPLMVAMVFSLTRLRALQRPVGWVAVGVLSLLVISGVNTLLDMVSNWAVDSDLWLAIVLFMYVVMTTATAVIYRPL